MKVVLFRLFARALSVFSIPVLLAAFLALAGCAGESVTRFRSASLAAGTGRSVAVLPLANLTTHPNAGQILGEMLFTELKAVPTLSLKDTTESWNLLAGQDQDPEEAALRQRVRQAGRDLGVDAVVYGSVTEYRYKRGLDEEPAVGVAVRMMDVASGEVLFAIIVSRIGGCELICRDSLSRTAQSMCAGIARDIREASAGKAPGVSGGES